MRVLQKFYLKRQTWVKVGGALAFLVAVASLYVFGVSGLLSNGSTGTTLNTPIQYGNGITPVGTVAFPTLPPTSPTPPLLPPRYQVAVHSDLNYRGLGSLNEQLDLCTPVGASGPRPGVILIHDIGVAVEDKSVYASLCSLLASQGFVAAAINFRKYPDVWPDQLNDAQLAVRWLRANAGQYSLDPGRLCAWGDSAGGYLSVFLGVLGNEYPGDEATLLTNQSPKVNCVVDDFGFVDLTTLPKTAFWQSAFGFQFGQNTPGVPLVTPTTLHDASPIFRVTSSSAPMFILHGKLDEVVPIGQSQELQRALQQAGVPVSYNVYNGGHGFSELAQPEINALKVQIINYLTAQEQP